MDRLKILLLPRYDRLGASSRMRMLQYLPEIQASGLEIEVSTFFDDEYLRRLYARKSTLGSIGSAFIRRCKRIISRSNADLVWLEKEALPWVPWLLERALLPMGIPLVSDYDDATFHRYDLHDNRAVRRLLGNKIDQVMANSTLVFAGNTYLADRARKAGAKRVEIVPTVVNLADYFIARPSGSLHRPQIGWIGTPVTWNKYMAPMLPLLAQLAAEHGAGLRAVGAGPAAEPDPNLEVMPWSEQTEIRDIQSMDIGIMPLDDSPWARGKCGYKLIQYMACGLPVVASPVGVNTEIVEQGVTGFLAANKDEWRQALTALLRDPSLRRRIGEAGRKKVEQEFSLQVFAPRVVKMLHDVASAKG